jgi:hypothetical protein
LHKSYEMIIIGDHTFFLSGWPHCPFLPEFFKCGVSENLQPF